MFASILYIFLALLGISFLIFIHELGHYFMARKAGITVEVFAIGFGKPIYQWEHKGVKWKIGWILFGGYVQMSGTEKKGAIEPYEIKDGFFGAKPWNRIKVAAMGPLVNIVFAFLAFSFLWVVGGREKPFSEFTRYIGWVDKESSLFEADIRPGDEIVTLNQKPFKSFNDFLHEALLEKGPLALSGNEINYMKGSKVPFTYTFPQDVKNDGMSKITQVIRSLRPAQYLIYNRMPSGAPNKLADDSLMEESGLVYGDRII